MKRLAGWCAALVAVCSVIIVIALVSTRGQSNPFASMSTTPDGQLCNAPCLFGIVPGSTNYEDGIKLLQQHPLTSQFKRIDSPGKNLITVVGGGIVINLRSSSSGVIREVLVFLVDDTDSLTNDLPETFMSKLYLGDADVYFRTPTRISIATTPLHTNDNLRQFASWYYDEQHLLLTGWLTDAHMRPTTPLKHIQLSADGGTLGEFSPVNFVGRVMVSYTTHRWFGFAVLTQYMKAAIKELGVRQLSY